MKKICILLAILMLLSLCACKRDADEQTAESLSLPAQNDAASVQDPSSEQKDAQSEAQNQSEPESVPEPLSEPESRPEVQLPQVETPTDYGLAQATAEDIDSALVIAAQLDGQKYYYDLDKIHGPYSYVCPLEDIDKALLKKTGKKVTVTFECSSPTDAVTAYAKSEATLYEIPDDLKTKPDLGVIALKLDIADEIMLFSTFDSFVKDNTLGRYLEKRCDGLRKDSTLISKIVITAYGKESKAVTLTAADDINAFFEKVRGYEYSADLARPITGITPDYTIEFFYKKGMKNSFRFYSREKAMRENMFGCATDADFETFMKSLLK